MIFSHLLKGTWHHKHFADVIGERNEGWEKGNFYLSLWKGERETKQPNDALKYWVSSLKAVGVSLWIYPFVHMSNSS